MPKPPDAKTRTFIAKARAIHGKRYDYSRSLYKGSETKLTIICPKHGPFQQSPYNHTSPRLRCGCKKCGNERAGLRNARQAATAFVERARQMHGTKYDYSKADYKHAHSKVLIICPVHGEFRQTPNSHILGQGCPTCGAMRRGELRRQEAASDFKAKARKVHGNKFDYSETQYLKANSKIVIRCPKHGPFLQRPNSHLRGVGCPGCKSQRLKEHFGKGFDQFVKDARKVHGRRYRYVDGYENGRSPITIICPEHGRFRQTPSSHLGGGGCPKCAILERAAAISISHAEFVKRARRVHRGKGFTYPERYKKNDIKMGIRCPKHGIFRQTPNNHLHGYGCPKCQGDASSARQRIGHAAFLVKARKVHGGKYRYPEEYQTAVIPITIVCPKHGAFRQIPNSHLAGNGCPVCNESSGERLVARALDRLRIRYARQKGFPTCRDTKPLRYDFFIPSLKLLIEYDGVQHFQSIDRWGGDKAFQQTVRRDSIKTKWAKQNGFRLLRIPYTTESISSFLKAELF